VCQLWSRLDQWFPRKTITDRQIDRHLAL
jgi:hypothetical protein